MDPNGWVTNPPQTIVKVVNTTRVTLNGSLGVVLAFHEDRARYVVHLAISQEQISLKADNLVKANMLDQVRAQYQLLKNDRNVQRQVANVYQTVQQRLGIQPEYAGAVVLVVLIAMMYVFGFTKVIMLLSFCMLCGVVIMPDIINGAPPRTILRNVPMRVKTLIRQHLPMGQRIASSNIMTGAVVAFFVVLFASSILRSGPRQQSSSASSSLSSGMLSRFLGSSNNSTSRTRIVDNMAMSKDVQEYYYKLGFDDGTAAKEFGSSLATAQPPPVKRSVEDYEHLLNDNGTVSRQKYSMLSWSSMFSLFYIGKTVYELGSGGGAGGGGRSWSFDLFWANAQHLQPWQLGMLALSVYRLVSPLLSR